MNFELLARDGRARRGRLGFVRGAVETPAFMPVGTYGTVKAMTPEELKGLGAQIVLGNTFHLMLRPGPEVIAAHGGLHRFMNWPGPILTDSGGFQVWSLAELRKLTEEGVRFRSPVNGDPVLLTPESSIAVQTALDADIVMVFDECLGHPATESDTAREFAEPETLAHLEHGTGIVAADLNGDGALDLALSDAAAFSILKAELKAP